ncbi:MAG TPA: Hpt domain-containing protein, partial [Urbifossiella sp.]|nr:Hpt domain-containing protein [Urbifossiella sp.]
MNDILREFLLETHENLSQLDLDLVTLEKEPGERETLARVFRTLHTVKGTAGFLGLTKLQGIAHAGENLLGRLRAGELPFTPETASALLGVVDAIRRILAALEAKDGNEEGSGDFTPVVRAVERLTAANAKSAVATPRVPAAAPAVATLPPPVSMAMPASPRSTEIPAAPAEARGAAVTDSSIRVDVGLLDKLMNL